MLLLLVAAAIAAQPQAGYAAVPGGAHATIRILSAVRLRVGAATSEDGRPVERSTVQTQDGTRQPAMLVQFE